MIWRYTSDISSERVLDISLKGGGILISVHVYFSFSNITSPKTLGKLLHEKALNTTTKNYWNLCYWNVNVTKLFSHQESNIYTKIGNGCV